MEMSNETRLELMMKSEHNERPKEERKYLCSEPCLRGAKARNMKVRLATRSSERDRTGAMSRLDGIPENLCSQPG